MKLVNISVLAYFCISLAHAAPDEVPVPAAEPAKPGFLKELAIGGARKIIGQDGSRFFVDMQDGSVDEIA